MGTEAYLRSVKNSFTERVDVCLDDSTVGKLEDLCGRDTWRKQIQGRCPGLCRRKSS